MVKMNIQRIVRHLLFTDWQARRAFSSDTLNAVEQAIASSEKRHCGQIRFAVEASLEGLPLLREQSARLRALEVFGQLGVWDTEGNNGVLIYVLLADRAVEIVADRGIHAIAGAQTWSTICQDMESDFSRSEFRSGALNGIAAVTELLASHFPARENQVNELPDAPVMLT
jgi:uncharacterized membrane protein